MVPARRRRRTWRCEHVGGGRRRSSGVDASALGDRHRWCTNRQVGVGLVEHRRIRRRRRCDLICVPRLARILVGDVGRFRDVGRRRGRADRLAENLAVRCEDHVGRHARDAEALGDGRELVGIELHGHELLFDRCRRRRAGRRRWSRATGMDRSRRRRRAPAPAARFRGPWTLAVSMSCCQRMPGS